MEADDLIEQVPDREPERREKDTFYSNKSYTTWFATNHPDILTALRGKSTLFEDGYYEDENPEEKLLNLSWPTGNWFTVSYLQEVLDLLKSADCKAVRIDTRAAGDGDGPDGSYPARFIGANTEGSPTHYAVAILAPRLNMEENLEFELSDKLAELGFSGGDGEFSCPCGESFDSPQALGGHRGHCYGGGGS